METTVPWWRRPGDVTAVALLIALPALVFGVPALLGHPVLPGDDMTQNFPLRVLAGREIRSGHLPLFDAYNWSGAPLLAGWNAGAAYPLTWLFAVLPGAAAWTFGLIATTATAGLGMFCFLRALRLRAVAGFLGALAFALAGAMSAQVTHFGLVAGMSWVPLALLAVLRVSEKSETSSSVTDHGGSTSPGSSGFRARRLRWAAVLAVTVGMMILAGEPRAIVDGCVIIGFYAVWQVARLASWRSPGSSLASWRSLASRRSLAWWRSLGPVRSSGSWGPAALLIAGGCLLGAGLGAVQWLPGLATISTSQRGDGTMALFSSGSLPPRWLALTLVPDLLGGSGSLSQPQFFVSYNLTEVTSYVGILPLVAALALLARAFMARGPDGRRYLPEWLIWHVLGVVGILLAVGGNSPLGTLLYRLPLFGSQRLQSRNILVLDLALAVLLAYWIDKPFPARAPVSSRSSRSRRSSRSSRSSRTTAAGRARARWAGAETLAALLAPLAVLVLVALSLVRGAGLLRWLGTGAAESAGVIGRLQPWLLPYGALAAAAIALVLFGRRLGRRGWARATAGFVVTDVVVFTVLGVVSVAPSSSTAIPPTPAAASATPAAPASAVPAGAASASASSGGVSSGGASSGSAAAARSDSATGAGAALLTSALTRASATGQPSAPPAPYVVSAARPVSALGYPGRFAIYDPDLLDTGDLSVLGPPDVNDLIAGGMPSVQGYSSIVDGAYATATGSHSLTGGGQNVLAPSAVGNGTLDALDTSILLTPAVYLTTTTGQPGPAAGPAGTGRRSVRAGQSATWYLGESATVTRVTIPDSDARADAATGTEIGLSAPNGQTQWFPARAASATVLEVSLPRPVAAMTLLGRARATGTTRVSGTTRVLGAPSVTVADGSVLVADGQLQDALVPPRWEPAGSDGGFAVFADRFAAGPLTIQPLPGQASAGRPGTGETDPSGSLSTSPGDTASGNAVPGHSVSGNVVAGGDASVRYKSSGAGDVISATVSSAHGVRLVRSVAAIPGWSATWQPRNGSPVTVPVQRDGIVQAVDVPAGEGTVTWHYTTPRFDAGLAISAAALLATLLLAVAGRRRRPAPGAASPRQLERQTAA